MHKTPTAPSQHAAAIPHASHMPFVCSSPSHDFTHALWPPSMHPNMFQCALPLLDVPCPFSTCHAPFQRAMPLFNMPPPSQTRPTHPPCAMAPAHACPAPPTHLCALHMLADGEWGRLCVTSELVSIPPSAHCACLSVHSGD